MSITEDIFSNNIMGSVTVYDSQDIRTLLPTTGLERLSFKFNTPGLPVMICPKIMACCFRYTK